MVHKMATLNISLTETLKDFVQKQVALHDFSNPSDYVRTLIREAKEKEQQTKEKKETLKAIIELQRRNPDLATSEKRKALFNQLINQSAVKTEQEEDIIMQMAISEIKRSRS